MEFELVAISPVAGVEVGQRITDPALIAEILGDERAALVRRVAKPEPVEAPKPGKPAKAD